MCILINSKGNVLDWYVPYVHIVYLGNGGEVEVRTSSLPP